MRISTTQFQLNSLNTILRQQSTLSKLQQQLGSGRRILSPADDPAGAAQALELSAKIENLEQLKKNGDLARHRLAVEEGVLAEFGDSLQRVRELLIQANNDSQSAGDRRLTAAELQELSKGLLQLANTDDGKGEYLFAGTATRTEPFVVVNGEVRYEGDQAERMVQVGPSRRVAVGHNGLDLFMKVPEANGSFVVQPGALNSGSGVADNGRLLGGGSPAYPYTVEFNGDGSQYSVDGGTSWIDYVPGEPITTADNLVQVTLMGEPAGGDTFTIDRAGTESVFAMVNELAAMLAGAEDSQQWRTEFHNAASRLLGGIDQAQERVLEARAETGARLKAVESESNAADNAILDMEEARSTVQDLDYASAISKFNLQLTGLQAAQQSYVKVQGLSLFNYL